MKKKNLLLICLLSTILEVNAQTAENKYAIGLYLGKNEYVGELGNGVLNFKQTFYLSEGLSLASYLNSSFDLGLQGNYGGYGYYFNAEPNNNFGGRKYEGSLFLHYKFDNGYFLDESCELSPFIELGWGLAGYTAGGNNQASWVDTKGTDFIVPFGLGCKYKINKNWSLQYKFVYNFTNHDYRDKLFVDGVSKKNDAFAEHSLGVIFSFGKPKDSDHDGVPDIYDKCPNTPANVKVDGFGCPIDTDGDGVPDYLDKCPNTPVGEKVDIHGCPLDSDGDGVADSLDKCSNTPKGVKVDTAGCPIDTDSDGVPDYLDKCPDVKGLISNKGCPAIKA